MNIKSLLLGSAAALVAVSGARAADAVVAPEPEPVEYVRVCDTYGTGFFYVPGTEVCLKIGGYWRYDIGAGDLFGQRGDTGDDTWNKRSRFQLRVDARTETELGTLRGYFAEDFQWDTITTPNGTFDPTLPVTEGNNLPGSNEPLRHFTGPGEGIEHAYVELGGFRIGVTDSLFVTETGYASNVVHDGLISYGPFTTHQIEYTFDAGNGFSISGAVEEGSDGETFGETINDYTPHIVVGAAWSGGIFGVSGVVGWDSNEDEVAVKGRIDIKPTDALSFFVMGAWSDVSENGDLPFEDPLGNYYAQWGGDWAFWAGGTWKFTDRVAGNIEFGYNELSDYSVDADVNVTVVPGFVVTPGIGYKHFDAAGGDDLWGGYIRTQFTF